MIGSFSGGIYLYYLPFGLLNLAIAVGLWKMKEWARKGSLILAAVQICILIFASVSLVQKVLARSPNESSTGPLGIAVLGTLAIWGCLYLIIYKYLSRDKIRQLFV